ncbi:hypothetical protein [uncultured Pontibacter sp.]|uniref:hypothetical protein n=1 Tax=uncultured Pontibacter sp. TaxID=453356 RepID=UPI00262F96B0|nr:hypothetical protein [uncultured Pontibacter sp.]
MKKTTHVVYVGFIALVTLTGCFEANDVAPTLDTESIKASVQGRWTIEKISNKLCRDNSCNTSMVGGSPQEYFEFKSDSAFLMRVSPTASAALKDAYKATYELGGVILLQNSNRTERFEVVELKAKKVVLQSVFTGRDPAAIFTDTYYLYR